MHNDSPQASARPSQLSTLIFVLVILTVALIAGSGGFYLFQHLARQAQQPAALLDVSQLNPDAPLADQLSPAQLREAGARIADTFYQFRDERGMYSYQLTCRSPEECAVTEPNHRAGYGLLWGLHQRVLHERDQAALEQLKTVIAAYQALIETNGYAFQNNSFNCLIMSDILENPHLTAAERETLVQICVSSVNEYYLADVPFSDTHSDEDLITEINDKLSALSDRSEGYDWEQDTFIPQLEEDEFLRQLGFNYFIYLPDAVARYQLQRQWGLTGQAEATRREILLNFDETLSLLYFYQASLSPFDQWLVSLTLASAGDFYDDINQDAALIEELRIQYQPNISAADLEGIPLLNLAQAAFVLEHLPAANNSDRALLRRHIIHRFYYNRHGFIGFTDSFSTDGWPRFDTYINGVLLGVVASVE
jgi:hypothetical protein